VKELRGAEILLVIVLPVQVRCPTMQGLLLVMSMEGAEYNGALIGLVHLINIISVK